MRIVQHDIRMRHTRNCNAITLIYTGAQFKRVSSNLVGPLTRAQRNYRYILTIVKYFTKHVKDYALFDK